MFKLVMVIEDIPDVSMLGLFYGLLGFMSLTIIVGWISKLVSVNRTPFRKQEPKESKNGGLNRRRISSTRKKSR